MLKKNIKKKFEINSELKSGSDSDDFQIDAKKDVISISISSKSAVKTS